MDSTEFGMPVPSVVATTFTDPRAARYSPDEFSAVGRMVDLPRVFVARTDNGILVALPVFMIAYLLINREKPLITITVTAAFWLVAWLLFDKVLRLAWPRPIFDTSGMLPF